MIDFVQDRKGRMHNNSLQPTPMVAAAGLRMLLSGRRPEPDAVRGTRAQRVALGIGLRLGIGVIAGLLGIGGGFLIVPLLMLMDYPMKTAAATTAFTVVFSSVRGFAGHLALIRTLFLPWYTWLPAVDGDPCSLPATPVPAP